MAVSLRLLVIDDNPADLELTQLVFEQLTPPVQVSTYESGEDALLALRAPHAALPDVILLDLNMPRMPGLEVLQALKADPALRHIPVVMLSTSSYPADVEQAYALQASGYLQKQVSFPDFERQAFAFATDWLAQPRRHSPPSWQRPGWGG